MTSDKSVVLQFYFTLMKLDIISYEYFKTNCDELVIRMVRIEAQGRFDKWL